MRRPTAVQWELNHSRAFFSAGGGCGAELAAWRAAGRAEFAVLEGKLTASALFDLVRFYERVVLRRLAERGVRLGFHARILRACIVMYLQARHAPDVASPCLDSVLAGACLRGAASR